MSSQKPIYILQKYLSEHISSRLLWEHRLGLLFTKCMQVRSGLTSQLSTVRHPCLLFTFPATHSFGKAVEADLSAFSTLPYIWLWIVLLPLCFSWTAISSIPVFSHQFTTAGRQEYFLLPNHTFSLSSLSEATPCLFGSPHLPLAGLTQRALS